jgi:hypothetical protein
MSDDVSSFAILQALTANPSADGTHVILELMIAGENLPISIPIRELGPMVALLSQAATKIISGRSDGAVPTRS